MTRGQGKQGPRRDVVTVAHASSAACAWAGGARWAQVRTRVSAFPRVFQGGVSTRRVAAAGTLPATLRHRLHPVVTRKRPVRCVPDARRHGES